MARVSPILTNVTAGEVSPALYGRVDLQKYINACRTLENFVVYPHGGGTFRPGTYYIDESIGRNEVTNGTFAVGTGWTLGAGWSIASGKAVGAAGSESEIKQTIAGLDEAVVYEVKFTISDRTAGIITPSVGGTAGAAKSADGSYAVRITCGSTTVLSFTKSATFDGKLDDVSCREINPVTREIPFQFSITQAYVLVFTDQNLRIIKDYSLITDGGSVVEVSTPYLAADLFELQVTQSADTTTIVHQNYKSRELTRTSHIAWTLEEIDFKDGPWEEQLDMKDIQSMTITGATQANPCVITVDVADAADDDYIKINDVAGMTELNGNFYRLDNKSGLTYSLKNMAGAAVNSTAYTAYSSGGLARCTIKPSAVNGSVTLLCWEDFFVSTDVGRLIRIQSQKIDEWEDTTNYKTGTYCLQNENYKCILDNTDEKPPNAMYWEESGIDGWYWAEITAFTSAKQVTATIGGDDLPNAYPIVDYRKGIWCSVNGYPGCVDYFEERMIFAGSKEYPQTLWASDSGNYDKMSPGTEDDDAFSYTIAARGVNPIRWIVPQNVLLMGTQGAEWKASSSNSEEPMNVTNISVKRQSTWGSKRVQALLANDVVLFVQRAGTKIRELTEDPNSLSYKYVAPDLSLLAEHITAGGIDEIAYQQEPIPIVWSIRGDGVLLGMTYERTQDVVGWYRITTYSGNDLFKSIAIIPGTTEDEPHVVVQRTVDGEVRKYLEYFTPFDWGDDRKDCFFLDSGLSSDNGVDMVITGTTKANPVVITVETAGAADGDFINIESVVGMIELNGNTYKLANNAGLTYELQDTDGNNIDGTGFTTYVSGGVATPVAKVYTGADHLEGRDVSVLADGAVLDKVTVASGSVTLDDYYNKVHIGLGYTGILTPMDIEAGAQAGTSQGKKKRVQAVTLRLKDSMACKVGPDIDNLEELSFMSDSDEENEPIPLFTGDKYKEIPHDWGTSALVTVVQDVPLPLTVLAIIPEMKTNEMA